MNPRQVHKDLQQCLDQLVGVLKKKGTMLTEAELVVLSKQEEGLLNRFQELLSSSYLTDSDRREWKDSLNLKIRHYLED